MPRPSHGFNQDPSKPWRVEAGKYFTRGRNNKLSKLAGVNMISEQHKLLFTPIAKCACTSLKSMMVQLAQVPHAKEILRMGVHRVTDEFNTGMHLKDLPLSAAQEIIEGEDYYKFAVVRDPIKRVISAYTEKFLINRLRENNKIHTGKVVRAVQATSNPDMSKGITFREFVHFIVSKTPAELDPHWAPQYLRLASIPHYDRIYRVDQMNELMMALEERIGTKVSLDKLNSSIASPTSDSLDKPPPGEVIDMPPCQLQELGELHSDMFMAVDVVPDLELYYAEDAALYQSTFEPSDGGYRPDLSPARGEISPVRSAQYSKRTNIWNRLQLYSKGFLGLQSDGSGSTLVAIVNDNNFPIGTPQFPRLQLETRVYGRDEKELTAEPQIHSLGEEIPASGILQHNLEIAIPSEWVQEAAIVQIVLTTAPVDGSVQNSLAHFASANIVLLSGEK
jgi:Sulfotransferase family